MPPFVRLICNDCGSDRQKKRRLKAAPPCEKCGGVTRYSDRWYIEVRVNTPNGMQRTKKSFRKQDDAIKEERRLLHERDQGKIETTGKKTFEHAAEVFLKWVDDQEKKGNLAKDTARPYRYRTERLKQSFAGMQLPYIDHLRVDAYVEERMAEGKKPATINREVATLKRLMSVAIRAKIIAVSPIHGYEMLEEDNEREVYLLEDQVNALLEECSKPSHPKHLKPIVTLALNTGLRRHGCLTLRWEEIDWRRNEIVKQAKGKKVVRIPMSKVLRGELKAWQGDVERVGLVFPSPKDPSKPMLVTSRFGFETACDALAKRDPVFEDFTFHDLRHTFATNFLEQFHDQIEVLRTILGHSSAYMTRRYAHITERARHTVMAAFEIGR